MGICARVSPVLATLAILVASCGGRAAPSTAPTQTAAPTAYELWVVDQAETTTTGGGTLYIYRGADLAAGSRAPAYTVNLGEAALGVGDGIGKHGHSITFNPAMTHAVIAYVDSGHVQVIRASDRKVVASIKMTAGAAGPAAPHATAVTRPHIIVASQVKNPMHHVQNEFARRRRAKPPGLGDGVLHGNNQLPFPLSVVKTQDVRRSVGVVILRVQFGDGHVAHQGNAQANKASARQFHRALGDRRQ